MNNFLIILSAPSGTGKTTISKMLIEKYSNEIEFSVSFTTRQPRSGEVNGVDYNFISIEEYEKILEKNLFLEHAKVFDNYYGTSLEYVNEIFSRKKNALVALDWQGMQSIKKFNEANKLFEILTIFLMPPSYDELKKRLIQRGDSLDIVNKRLNGLQNDISHAQEYDYILVNDSLPDVFAKVKIIYESKKLLLKKNTILKSSKLNNTN